MRLTRRGRAVLVIAVALLSLGGFWLGTRAAGYAQAERPPSTAGLPWVQVREGDTLWSIAEAVAHPGEDPTAVVKEIRRLNGLTGSLIRSGTRLHVPGGAVTPLHQGQ
ncbi:LysM peptidoglycan-binding domain-containing protein [Nonomuraea sp. NPDC048826]|uniref:LysM peptidoglycan-binding domain-containing protein n=1 Tax=Nonomuraea sp. NPDC048826 TaxID=3364347 RepID=UPI0037211792